MASDDPLAGYTPTPDPLAGYTPTSNEELQPRSLSQVGTDIGNFARVAGNTYGLYDRAASAVTGNSLESERAKTAQASHDVGPVGSLIASMMGAGPVGAIGAAGKIGKAVSPAVGNWLGGIIGSGAEGAGLAAAGAAGRGDDISKSALIGGAGGAAVGAIPGAVGRGTLPAGDTADQLAAKYKAQYDQADKITFPRQAVSQTATSAGNAIAQQSPRIALEGKGASGVLDDMRNEAISTNGMSAARLNDYLKKLHSSQTGDSVPVAGQIAQAHISNLIDSNPQASQTLKDANALYGQSQDMARLDNWQQKAAVNGGPDVATQAKSYLTSERGQDFAPPGSPTYEALNALAGQGSKGSYVPWWVKHYIMAPVAGVALGEGMHAATGDENSPLTRVSEDLGLGLMLGGGMSAYRAGTGAMASAAQKRAIDAARSTIGTGTLHAPVQAPNQVGDLLRRIYTQAAPGIGSSGR